MSTYQHVEHDHFHGNYWNMVHFCDVIKFWVENYEILKLLNMVDDKFLPAFFHVIT